MRLAAAALLVFGLASAAGTTNVTTARRGAAACDRELWDLKTLSDPRRNLVDLRPVLTTVAAISARRAPPGISKLRSPGFERHVWQVDAQIVEYKLEADNDIQIVLAGDGAYVIAAMPAPACLPKKTRGRRAIINARRLFESRCGAAEQARALGAVAEIDGVGFWDFGQSGHRDYPELHPVTRLRFVSGCGN
jgi:hypothetical protein